MKAAELTFLEGLASEDCTHQDRAVALLWLVGERPGDGRLSTADICAAFVAAGYPAQNRFRLEKALKSDRRVRTLPYGQFAIAVTAKESVAERFGHLIQQREPKASSSVLPQSLFTGARGYHKKVVLQINASYDGALFDCTAVMCRRLVETLIIETYEASNRADELIGRDGKNYMMLGELVGYIETDPKVKLGRESLRGLKAFKSLGDQAAHNRRFNARRDDIDRVRDGLRLVVEELLHLAGYG